MQNTFEGQKQHLKFALGVMGLLGLLGALMVFRTGGAYGQATLAVDSLFHTGNICLVSPVPAQTGFFMLLGAGLLTGLSHCVGMCGPLVGAFAVRRRAAGQSQLSTPLMVFQLGRLTTYMVLGAMMGGLGSLFNLAATIRGWQSGIAIGIGSLLILVGLGLLNVLPTQRLIESFGLARLVSHLMKNLIASNRPVGSFGLGLVNGLLPCGAVYAMSLLAASTGTPMQGALVMLIFGLGTLPAMIGVGFSVSTLSLRLRATLFRLAAGLVILMGLQLILRGLALGQLVPHLTLGGTMLW